MTRNSAVKLTDLGDTSDESETDADRRRHSHVGPVDTANVQPRLQVETDRLTGPGTCHTTPWSPRTRGPRRQDQRHATSAVEEQDSRSGQQVPGVSPEAGLPSVL